MDVTPALQGVFYPEVLSTPLWHSGAQVSLVHGLHKADSALLHMGLYAQGFSYNRTLLTEDRPDQLGPQYCE